MECVTFIGGCVRQQSRVLGRSGTALPQKPKHYAVLDTGAMAEYSSSTCLRWTRHGSNPLSTAIRQSRKALPDPPTAVFCFCDRTAVGAYKAAVEAGLIIVRDLAVMGFDIEA